MKQGKYKIKDLPKADRPREKLTAKGSQNLKDEELLAILLRTGREGKNILDLAITKRITEAGKIIGIDVLDHIIITKTKVFSFKKKKLL